MKLLIANFFFFFCGDVYALGWPDFVKALHCEQVVSHTDHPKNQTSQALFSLQQLQQLLRAHGQFNDRTSLTHYEPYAVAVKDVSQQSIALSRIKTILSRLATLEDDVTRLRDGFSFQALELRGWQRIEHWLEAIEGSFDDVSYVANPMRSRLDESIEQVLYRLNDSFQRLKDRWADPRFYQHLELIKAAVSHQSERRFPLSLYGDDFIVPDFFDGDDLFVFVDYLFYFDPQYNEPVFVFYQRTFREKPQPPRRRIPKEFLLKDPDLERMPEGLTPVPDSR